jgi:hypothetical protein
MDLTAADTSAASYRQAQAEDLEYRAERFDAIAEQAGFAVAKECRSQAAAFRAEARALRALYE